jgi:hypothetical protein
MRWTEDQLVDHLKRKGSPGAENKVDTSNPPFMLPANPAGRYALGRLPVGAMNRTEAAYADHLEMQRRAGAVEWFKFEALKFRLADNTFYTPDFIVLTKEGFLEAHEVKGGFWMEDARVKIKVAASIYPLRFIGVMPIAKSKGGGWKMEEFS